MRVSKVSPATISDLNKKAYVHIEDWRHRPLQGGRYPYVYVDGIYLRRNWGGEYENVAILVAIAVNEAGYREVLGAAEGMKKDKASWVSFFQWLRGRGLDGVELVVGDKCLDTTLLATIVPNNAFISSLSIGGETFNRKKQERARKLSPVFCSRDCRDYSLVMAVQFSTNSPVVRRL